MHAVSHLNAVLQGIDADFVLIAASITRIVEYTYVRDRYSFTEYMPFPQIAYPPAARMSEDVSEIKMTAITALNRSR